MKIKYWEKKKGTKEKGGHNMIKVGSLNYEISQDRNATICHVYGELDPSADKDDRFMASSASSRRHPHDRHDPRAAHLLALGRALQQLGRQIERRGNGLVKHNDDIAIERLKQKKKRNNNNNKERQQA